YYCQVNLVAPLIVGFSGKTFLVHVVVLDRFVEVEPHLIAPADPVLDIESVVRILPEDTQEILYGKVFSNGPHMQFTRLEVCPEESRVQVGGPNHNFTYVVISHWPFDHAFGDFNVLPRLLWILFLGKGCGDKSKNQ